MDASISLAPTVTKHGRGQESQPGGESIPGPRESSAESIWLGTAPQPQAHRHPVLLLSYERTPRPPPRAMPHPCRPVQQTLSLPGTVRLQLPETTGLADTASFPPESEYAGERVSPCRAPDLEGRNTQLLCLLLSDCPNGLGRVSAEREDTRRSITVLQKFNASHVRELDLFYVS